jgi:hypothetical protein
LAAAHPAVRVESGSDVRVLPRVKPGSAVIHVVNYRYESARDEVQPISGLKLRLNWAALQIAEMSQARWTDLEGTVQVPVQNGIVELPRLNLWGILSFENGRAK